MPSDDLPASSPFVGPRPFTADERDAFFGRDEEISRLASLVIAHPVVLLYAVSGAGKTSLLSAGLLPALVEQSFDVVGPIRLQIPDPERREAGNAFVHAAVRNLGAGADSASNITATLCELPRGTDSYGFGRPRALIIDQFEELFTLYPSRWRDRDGFIAEIANALAEDSDLRVVLALREEYLAQLERYAALLPSGLGHAFTLSACDMMPLWSQSRSRCDRPGTSSLLASPRH